MGGTFPHISNTIYPALTTTSFFSLLDTSDPIQMAYFNDTNNASFHPVSDVPGELGFYPFAEQTSGTEEVGMLDNSAFSDRWSMVGQPEPVACSPTNLWDTASGYGECQFHPFVDQSLTREPPDQVASATSYSSWDNGYGQPLYPDYHLPGAIQQTRYCHPGFSGWDVPLADVAVPEILAVAPIPSSGECRSHLETSRDLILTNL